MKTSIVLFTLLLLFFSLNNNAVAKGVVILECELRSVDPAQPLSASNRVVSRLSNSVVLPIASRVNIGESCSVALAKILKANFTIASVNFATDNYNNSLVYTLVSIL